MPLSYALGPASIAPIGLGYRNLIINGAMQVAQRATSVSGIATTGYRTADRWKAEFSSLGTWTQSVENDAPTGSGFRKSLKMLCTTADASPSAGDLLIVQQPIEGQNLQSIKKGTSLAEQITVSFWVKSNVTGTYIAELYDADNTRQVSASYSISASATWEKKTIVFPADTTGPLDNDNANSMQINFWLGSGTTYTSGTLNTTWASVTQANRVVGQTNVAAATNNYWQITGVQLEVGPVATAYEFKPIDVELAQCQRYLQQSRYGLESCDLTLMNGVALPNSAYKWIPISFPVEMRAAPTVTFESGAGAGFDNKARYVTGTGSGAGNDVTPYTSASRTTGLTLKSYNEADSFTHYGILAGYRADAEL